MIPVFHALDIDHKTNLFLRYQRDQSRVYLDLRYTVKGFELHLFYRTSSQLCHRKRPCNSSRRVALSPERRTPNHCDLYRASPKDRWKPNHNIRYRKRNVTVPSTSPLTRSPSKPKIQTKASGHSHDRFGNPMSSKGRPTSVFVYSIDTRRKLHEFKTLEAASRCIGWPTWKVSRFISERTKRPRPDPEMRLRNVHLSKDGRFSGAIDDPKTVQEILEISGPTHTANRDTTDIQKPS